MKDLGIDSWFGSFKEYTVSFDPTKWKIVKIDEFGEIQFINIEDDKNDNSGRK